MKKMTALEIIDDTYQHFSNNPRATNNDICCYCDMNGKKCAVGRYALNPEEMERKYKEKNVYSIIKTVDPNLIDFSVEKKLVTNEVFSHARTSVNEFFDSLLREEVRGHTVEFWSSIQYFHDSSYHWKDQELTEEGQTFLQSLREIYGEE